MRVIRSPRRTKSSAARIVDGVIEVRIPARMSEAEERDTVRELVRRIEKKRALDENQLDLLARGRTLAAIYRLPMAREIRWVTNQNTLWGSCSYPDSVIRLSSRLAKAPEWVVDYVLLHELTHLVESAHTAEFHRLMARYPRAERAEGFLEAMTLCCAASRFVVGAPVPADRVSEPGPGP